MKITLFTGNHNRHNFLVNLLSGICDELFVIQESTTIFTGVLNGEYAVSNNMKKYFKNVINAQEKFFNQSKINGKNKNINILPLQMNDLNNCSLNYLAEFLSSDIYITYGCSYIKGDLIDFLIKHKTINIHMGLSPYYLGADCNFWALYDNNPHLVGATIHLLSKGLDSGPMLYHAMSNLKKNPYVYTMSTVKAAFHSIAEKIKNKTIFEIDPLFQEKSKEVRYSRKIEFNEKVINEYFNLNVKNEAGAIAKVSSLFAEKNISIEALIQKESKSNKNAQLNVPVIIISGPLSDIDAFQMQDNLDSMEEISGIPKQFRIQNAL